MPKHQVPEDDLDHNITDSESCKWKTKITERIPVTGSTKDVEIGGNIECLGNFSKILEIPLINCKINLMLTWSAKCAITNSAGKGRSTDTKLNIPVVTNSTQEQLLEQLISGFKRTINWNKYQSKVSI